METISVVSGDSQEAGAGGDIDAGTQGISIVQIALPDQTVSAFLEL